jgi:DNA-binding protein YbaB
MERPNWNALSDMIGDLRRVTAGIPDMQQRMLSITGTAWSDDRMIKAVVGPRGHLLELDIDPRVYRKPNSKALAADIVATVRRAIEEATRQTREILDEGLPSDMRVGLGGGPDIGKLVHGHDADVRLKGDGNDE